MCIIHYFIWLVFTKFYDHEIIFEATHQTPVVGLSNLHNTYMNEMIITWQCQVHSRVAMTNN